MSEAESFFNLYRAAGKQETRKAPWFIILLRTLLMLLLMTLITDLSIVMFVPEGLQMLKDAYNQEVEYLSVNIDRRSTEFISNWVNTAYEWVFIKTSIHEFLYSRGNQVTDSLVSGFWPLLQGALIGFQIFMIRLSVIILMLPFVILVMLVAASDGYLGWYRRRTSGARESAFIYHRSKRLVSGSIIALWFLYLIPPFAIDPAIIFIPSILIAAIFTRLSIQFFKKYV